MTSKEVENRVRRLARELRERGIRSVLLGLSGGADSVLTFHLLRMAGDYISDRFCEDFRLGVVHVNFNLRGEESLRDEEFVKLLLAVFPRSAGAEIAEHYAKFDTAAYCSREGISIEMGARKLRHDLFREICSEEDYDRIATGHNADDNEETLLLNMLRGSGTRGLRAMTADNGRILRPILRVSRKEVRTLLREIYANIYKEGDGKSYAEAGIERLFAISKEGYVTDSSNLSDNYRRNYLRNKIIPMLEERWEGTHRALQTTLRLLQEENKIIEAAVAGALKGVQDTLPWERMSAFPSPITLLRSWIAPMGGTPEMAREISGHIPARGRRCMTPGRRWQLPGGGALLTTHDALKYESGWEKGMQRKESEEEMGKDKKPPYIDSEKRVITERVITRRVVLKPENAGEVSQAGLMGESVGAMTEELKKRIKGSAMNECWLPASYEECGCGYENQYEWRRAKRGEKMKLFGSGSKLISDILKEGGVPQSLRGEVSVLVEKSSDEAVWIPGLRRAAIALISFEEGSEMLWKLAIPE